MVDILGSIDEKIENNEQIILKLTDLGLLTYQDFVRHNGYELVELNELVKIGRGASPRPIQNYLTQDGNPWVKISDVTALKTPFLYKTSEYITDKGTSHSVAVFPDDLILSNSATPGLPIFVELPAFVHDGWLTIRDFKQITPQYLYWVLKNDREKILSQGNGSIFTNLKTDILKQHKIPVPDKETMRELDKKFSTILALIKQLTIKDKQLKELKQLYLKKFFG